MVKHGSLRIISGTLKHRLVSVPAIPGLRPTTDRLRETLFNWLMPNIAQSHCLDLFCGSGILGLEALSRGAQFVSFVDANPAVIQHIHLNLQTFNLRNADTHCWPLPAPHQQFTKQYDIVFLDPPFTQDLLIPCCQWLETCDCLTSNAMIYLESERRLALDTLPNNWRQYRLKQTKHVQAALYQREE